MFHACIPHSSFIYSVLQTVLHRPCASRQDYPRGAGYRGIGPGGGGEVAICWNSRCYRTDGGETCQEECHYILS